MKNESKIKIDVWSEPDIAGVVWHDIIEIPADSTDEEIESAAKEVAHQHFEWGYDFYRWWGTTLKIFKHKGCKYCKNRAPIINDGTFELRIIYGNYLTANFGGKKPDSERLIYYCPICGRKLV